MARPRMIDPVKHCAACNARLYRSRTNGRLQDRKRFNQREYCDAFCMGAHRRRDDAALKVVRDMAALKELHPRCQACGDTDGLTWHRGKALGLEPSRAGFLLLCPPCLAEARKAASPLKCEVCGRPQTRLWHGLCGMHYQRLLKHGDPLLTTRFDGESYVLVRDSPEGAPELRANPHFVAPGKLVKLLAANPL